MAPKRKGQKAAEEEPGDQDASTTRNWLLKSEPTEFSWEQLSSSPNQTASWEGVRNSQARNNLRSMKLGDEAFFYHSNCKTPAVVGIVKVVREAYPDHSAWEPGSKYHDQSSTPDNPKWWMVDVQLVRALQSPVSLDSIKRAASGSSAGPAKKRQKKGGRDAEPSAAKDEEDSKEKGNPGLAAMELLNRPRLSVQKVTPDQWQAVLALEGA